MKNAKPIIKQKIDMFREGFTFHTNFEISDSVAKQVTKMTGVKNAMNVIRYQLDVSVGICFDKNNVARRVKRLLLKNAVVTA